MEYTVINSYGDEIAIFYIKSWAYKFANDYGLEVIER